MVGYQAFNRYEKKNVFTYLTNVCGYENASYLCTVVNEKR